MKRIEKKKYDVQNSAISTILGWIENGEIGLPELQRPFVWNTVKVRDLIDSLYHGYPIGYIITWDNPKVRLKDGVSVRANGLLLTVSNELPLYGRL